MVAHAEIATSARKTPHNGRFHACNDVHAESWSKAPGIGAEVRLIIKRGASGFYAVLKMDHDAAALIGVDLLKRVSANEIFNALQSLSQADIAKLHAAIAASFKP